MMRRWMRQALRLAQRLVLTDAAPPPAPVSAPVPAPAPAGPPPEAVPESGIPAAFAAEEIPAIAAPPGPHEQLPLPLLVQPAGPGVSVPGTFIHSQGTRDYLLYLPPMATGQPPPLVVMLHGCGQDAADFARGTGMDEAARAAGALVLYPEQPGSANPGRCWNWFSRRHQQRSHGEPALLAAMVQHIAAAHGVDLARIYVAGLSAGGGMAVVLGNAFPDLFAAVGVHSGVAQGLASDVMDALAVMRNGPVRDAPPPSGGGAPPVIVFHGDADATVHPRNGAQVLAAALLGHGLAGGPPLPPPEVHSGTVAGRSFTRSTYAAADGWGAEYWELQGGGHAWSGGNAGGSHADPAGPSASAEMLRFFLAHRRPQQP
ncbi:MAG TPA: PHB depolymerase family esterase [Burkholderiaceae bacterium]